MGLLPTKVKKADRPNVPQLPLLSSKATLRRGHLLPQGLQRPRQPYPRLNHLQPAAGMRVPEAAPRLVLPLKEAFVSFLQLGMRAYRLLPLLCSEKANGCGGLSSGAEAPIPDTRSFGESLSTLTTCIWWGRKRAASTLHVREGESCTLPCIVWVRWPASRNAVEFLLLRNLERSVDSRTVRRLHRRRRGVPSSQHRSKLCASIIFLLVLVGFLVATLSDCRSTGKSTPPL